ncbi:MAG: putative peptidoglycan glycosyltransferase FtsW [bacterium]|nr:putative peptidoglycan glycosyltransferase FtsW [bacterium]
MKPHAIDRFLFLITATLVVVGFLVFSSAALGLLAKEGAQFGAVALRQLVYGLGFGSIAFLITSNLYYRHLRRYAFYIFTLAFILTLLVFVPGIGLEHAGAKRWVEFGSISFQPGEFLKVAFIIYFAAWLSGIKNESEKHITNFGFIPFLILSGLTGGVLLLQPDTDGFLVIALSGAAMFFVSGGRLKHFLLLFLVAIIGATVLFSVRPYIKERVLTFVNINKVDSLGAGYQINQSLIAIGSGGITGRGFGQSVQKFEYLPEAIGDSIFAVAGEEFGFIGASFLIILFLCFGLRGLRVATRAPDIFGVALGSGIVIHIISQSFINIASMLALFPLSGTSLVFVSQGGTSLLIALAEVGILLNISRYQTV